MEVVFSIAQKIAVLHQGRIIAEGEAGGRRGDAEVKSRSIWDGLTHVQ